MVKASQGGPELVECVLIDWVRVNSLSTSRLGTDAPSDYSNLTVSLTAHRMLVCLYDRC